MTAGDHEPARRRSRLLLWAVLALAGVVVAAGALAAVLRSPAQLPPGSPEAVVQRYLQAVLAGDHERAARHLAHELAAACDPAVLRSPRLDRAMRATLEDVHRAGGRAEVQVRVHTDAGSGPLGVDTYSHVETYVLTEKLGDWRLVEPPWPLYHCAPEPSPPQPRRLPDAAPAPPPAPRPQVTPAPGLAPAPQPEASPEPDPEPAPAPGDA